MIMSNLALLDMLNQLRIYSQKTITIKPLNSSSLTTARTRLYCTMLRSKTRAGNVLALSYRKKQGVAMLIFCSQKL